MNPLDYLRRKFAVLRRKNLESELNEELRFHIEMRALENLRAGMNIDEAKLAALRQFGSTESIKESCRDVWGVRWLQDLCQDARFAARQMTKSPVFTLVSVITLGLAIGSNTAFFHLIEAVVLQSLPVREPERLFSLTVDENDQFIHSTYQFLARENNTLIGLLAFGERNLAVSAEEHALPVEGLLVSGNYFSILGVNPLRGRLINPDDDRIGNAQPIAVISHRYWRNRFGGAASIVGSKIEVNGTVLTVVGIGPRDFFGLTPGRYPDIFIPLSLEPVIDSNQHQEWMTLDNPDWDWLHLVGRIRRATDQAKTQAELNVLFHRLESEKIALIPQAYQSAARLKLSSQSLRLLHCSRGFGYLRNQYSSVLFIVSGIFGLVLLITCVNIASLLIARAQSREQEISIRLALGAGHYRLIRQLLTESLLLSTLGGIAGVCFAAWTQNLLLKLILVGQTLALKSVASDLRVLVFAVVISLGTGLLFGFIPALALTRFRMPIAWQPLGHASVQRGFQWRTGKILVVSQVALALVILTFAGLFVRSLTNLNGIKPGFQKENVLLIDLAPGLVGFNPAQRLSLFRELPARIESLPGVRSASLALFKLPDSGDWYNYVSVPGYTPTSDADRTVWNNFITRDYFRTVGITLLAGRDLRQQDDENAPKVAIVNEAFARFYFPNQNPIGRRFRIVGEQCEIVGLVKDVKYDSFRKKTPRIVYMPLLQRNWGFATLHVLTVSPPGAFVALIKHELESMVPTPTIVGTDTLSDRVEAVASQERSLAELASAFGLMALFLESLGLYGVLAYAVAHRRREMGIRMAVGAQPKQIRKLILCQALGAVLVGAVLGLACAVASTHFIPARLLYGMTALDPLTLVFAILSLASAATVASWLPARRAAAIDPSVALRAD